MKTYKGTKIILKQKNEKEQKGREMFFAFIRGLCYFFFMRKSYFSVPFNPKLALPPWVSWGAETQGPRGQVSLPVTARSLELLDGCPRNTRWLVSRLHPALMGQL